MTLRAFFLFCVMTLAATSVHAASDQDTAAADLLFNAGRRAALAEDWATACIKFAQSYELDPSPGALLNLGDCEEHRDHLATAWRHFRRLAESLPETDERKELATRRAATVLARAPQLRIAVASRAPTLVVTRNGEVVNHSSFGIALPVDAGLHLFRVSAAGRKPATSEVTLHDGEIRDVSLVVGESVEPEPAPLLVVQPSKSVDAVTPRDPRDPLPWQRITGFSLVGVGATSFVIGVALGGAALAAEGATSGLCVGNVCKTSSAVNDHERAKRFALAADVLLGVGVVLAAVGVVLVLTSPRSPVTLIVTPQASGASLGGTF